MESIFSRTVSQTFMVLLPIYICSLYFFIKSLNLKIDKKITLVLLLIAVINSAAVSVIELYSFSFSRIIFLATTILSFRIIDKNKFINTFIVGVVSIGIVHSFRAVSIFIAGTVFLLLGATNFAFIEKIVIILMQILITVALMKIKRFKNGLIFLKERQNIGLGLIISGLIVICSCIDTNASYTSKMTISILVTGIIISAAGLVIWIRRSITMHYRKKLESRAEDYYKNQLDEKDKYIEQLLKSNEFLAKIVHRDNHLISALNHTIQQYLTSENETQKEQILNEIFIMFKERSELIHKEQISSKILPSTGITIIDGALGNMYVKATAKNIDFDIVVNEPIYYIVNNFISQTELETLLCDHIKDAIIAIQSSENISGKILVTITAVDHIYEISVQDNGIDFEIDTLQKLGFERVTTHKDSGGSGIGFMTTFETLKKANASLVITEYETKQPFSKSITFKFDGQNKFVIKTYRKDEIISKIQRKDIIIL